VARAPQALGPLTPNDIRYLALEGGGGKGIAFLGAIQALEALDVLRYTTGPAAFVPPDGRFRWASPEIDAGRRLVPGGGIAGISGASAGAITALLLSCGYNASDIRRIMVSFDFDSFFEGPRPRKVPRLVVDGRPEQYDGAVEVVGEEPPAPKEFEPFLLLLALLGSGRGFGRGLPPELSGGPGSEQVESLKQNIWFSFLTLTPLAVRDYARQSGISLPKAGEVLLDDFLPADLGFFSGTTARRFLAELIAYKMPLRNGTPQYNASFRDHARWFRNKLVVTGTNLESEKSGLFSVDTTPNMPVADAVRISMSLPLVFKPLVIRPEHFGPIDLPDWLEGVWVDGGYLNNLPLHVFDHEPNALRHTLGLRLGLDVPPRIEHFGHFLSRWPVGFGFLGAGEAHVGPGTRNDSQVIVLDVEGLDLLTFTYPEEKIDDISGRNYKRVLEYFPGG
jgi:predicted acylesterase/phospholipase RssA